MNFRNIESPKARTLPSRVDPFAREIGYFLECADQGSILRASERLNIQQAGLSKAIQKLESELSQALFHRTTRGIHLTEYGQALFDSLSETRLLWDKVHDRQMNALSDSCGPLRLAAHSTVALSYFPAFLPRLMRLEGVDLDVQLFPSIEVTRRVAEMKSDIGLVINPVKNAEIIAKKVRKEALALWRSKKESSGVLAFNPETYLSARILGRIKKAHRTIEVGDYELIAQLVKQSDLLGLLPESTARRFNLQMVGAPLLTVDLSVIWHHERFKTPRRREALELVLRSFA